MNTAEFGSPICVLWAIPLSIWIFLLVWRWKVTFVHSVIAHKCSWCRTQVCSGNGLGSAFKGLLWVDDSVTILGINILRPWRLGYKKCLRMPQTSQNVKLFLSFILMHILAKLVHVFRVVCLQFKPVSWMIEHTCIMNTPLLFDYQTRL